MSNEVASLWLLRHGQSIGNVARDAARRDGLEVLDIAERDMDVALSPLGRQQAEAFGTWLGTEPPERRPDVIVSSPYSRSAETARLVAAAAGLDGGIVHLDERLREREFGVLDLLTRRGIAARFPEEMARRQRLGKFYHRPPGGESWVDVALRLRSLRDSLVREHADRRVLLVSHEVVIIIVRYLIEDLDEAGALAISDDERLANCSLTSYERDGEGRLVLERDAWTGPLEQLHAAVTEDHDASVAPR